MLNTTKHETKYSDVKQNPLTLKEIQDSIYTTENIHPSIWPKLSKQNLILKNEIK